MAKEGSTVSGLMDSFATAVSLALQHGVPLRVLCEKFAHTRFEPSGWTGNEQIGYAKSIMDYIFRWIQIRFLSGHQLDLFSGLAPQQAIPVEGAVTSPGSTVVPSLSASSETQEMSSFREPGSPAGGFSPRGLEAGGPAGAFSPDDYHTTTPPQQGIAPEPSATIAKDLSARSGLGTPVSSFEDRGVYHVADAMKDIVDMRDSPSCATCGAIMTRSGSCYRCMSCGSTSGCS
jgi:ribonucleoside-diphosphate reductase alpha chain